MSLRVLAIVCALIAISATAGRSYAQERPSEGTSPPASQPPDEVFMRALADRKQGLIFFEVIGAGCPPGVVSFGRAVDGKPTAIKLFQYGGIGGLEPGQYSVLSVKCTTGTSATTFNGPFATFRVGVGEIVNIGALKLDYKLDYLGLSGTGTLHKAIVSTGVDTIARLKEKIPRTFAKMINRPMTLVGPADIGIKRR